ncbi:unnamed protein product, partial [Mesorhabditis spiculigera]
MDTDFMQDSLNLHDLLSATAQYGNATSPSKKKKKSDTKDAVVPIMNTNLSATAFGGPSTSMYFAGDEQKFNPMLMSPASALHYMPRPAPRLEIDYHPSYSETFGKAVKTIPIKPTVSLNRAPANGFDLNTFGQNKPDRKRKYDDNELWPAEDGGVWLSQINTWEDFKQLVPDEWSCVKLLFREQMLRSDPLCPKCGRIMKLRARGAAFEWRCRRPGGGDCASRSIKRDSFFEDARAGIRKKFAHLLMWIHTQKPSAISKEIELSLKCLHEQRAEFRSVCTRITYGYPRLGGNGALVEVGTIDVQHRDLSPHGTSNQTLTIVAGCDLNSNKSFGKVVTNSSDLLKALSDNIEPDSIIRTNIFNEPQYEVGKSLFSKYIPVNEQELRIRFTDGGKSAIQQFREKLGQPSDDTTRRRAFPFSGASEDLSQPCTSGDLTEHFTGKTLQELMALYLEGLTGKKACTTEPAPPVEHPPRRSYDVGFKLEVAAFAKANSIHSASRKYDVARKNIQTWIRQREVLQYEFEEDDQAKRKRLLGAGRRVRDDKLENDLVTWICERRASGQAVSRSLLQKQAIKMSSDPSFKASNGWLESFLKRNKMVQLSEGIFLI